MIRYKITRYDRSMYAEGIYCKMYEKETIVNAVPGTFGIMTFDTFLNASEFLGEKKGKIIKVRPIGRGKRIKFISAGQYEGAIRRFYEDQFYKNSFPQFSSNLSPVPKGTICYQSVEVLE